MSAVVDESVGERLGHRSDPAKILEVPLPFSGQGDVHRVVEVIGPLGVETIAASVQGLDEARVIGVALGDEIDAPAERPALVSDRRYDLFQNMQRTLVDDLVRRIQTEPVEVKLGYPV